MNALTILWESAVYAVFITAMLITIRFMYSRMDRALARGTSSRRVFAVALLAQCGIVGVTAFGSVLVLPADTRWPVAAIGAGAPALVYVGIGLRPLWRRWFR